MSKAEVYPEGPSVSPVIESSVGVKRSLNLPTSDYDGHRRLRKMKSPSQVDSMLEPGAGYGSTRRGRNSSNVSSRRTSIDSSASIAPPTRNFARSVGPDLSFIHDSHPLVASRQERDVYAGSNFSSPVSTVRDFHSAGKTF